MTHVAPGDAVAFCLVPACGRCGACAAGRRNLCEVASAAAWAGTLLDGSSRLRFPDGAPVHALQLPLVLRGALRRARRGGRAGAAGAAAVAGGAGGLRGRDRRRRRHNAARVAAGETVCVIGCGGVGLQLVAACRLAGAGRIIAVDRNAARLDLGAGPRRHARGRRGRGHRRRGARGLAGGGVDHAFEAVGTPATIRLAWDVLRPGATAIVVGVTPAGRRRRPAGVRAAVGEGDPRQLLRLRRRRRR